MTMSAEAIARYHKILEQPAFTDLAWAKALQEQKSALNLEPGAVSPVLRPHFITQRDYSSLSKASELLLSAMDRMLGMVASTPALMARIQMLPAERMLSSIEPGGRTNTVASHLGASFHDGVLRFNGYAPETGVSVLCGDDLSNLYYDIPPVKEFRKKFKLKKIGGTKPLLSAVLKTYKEFGGKQKKPSIGIIENRPLGMAASTEATKLLEFFRSSGIAAEIVPAEHLEYRNGVLHRGDFRIDIVYRNFKLQEFLLRFDLNHPLMRAYKERAVCLMNTFRAELGAKKALFDLLTDDKLTAKFPAAERKVIKDHLPWTRIVQAAKTTHKNRSIDLPEYVMKHRSKLVLIPNDESSEIHPVRGASVDDAMWERALRRAMRSPFVVQEVVEHPRAVFPMLHYGSLVMKEMTIQTLPQALHGSMHSCSAWLDVAGSSSFSTLTGLAPTFLLEGK